MAEPKRTVVTTSKAPGPYPALSQAVIHKDLVFCSGSLGMNPETKSLVEGTIGDRTTQALTNLQAVLEAAGSSAEKVLKVTIYVTNLEDIPAMNEAYIAFFSEPRPARACVCVKALARDTDVEIECVGYI